ncbi:SDR family NAD(P)-dependent oxidoreductase [Nocardia sp. NBC_00565]|uniref:SDR family NAD(P)-dependent oxidoreductase n=1 Tax=Nocardia sp. NBC_00565 TaxID=2975993 RepID=UPI002E81BA6E|nr:SDR family NAD(P)-dependent oxidoreductase [Nocardia sp. NBC_00565]WUC07936.1 SDR family NAD(P)-dependent oxidoreductase [Nocardia sp. NBC_00565]
MTEEPMLSGRGAVVIGGGSGIGLAVAELLAGHGAGVVINSRDESAVQGAAETITRAGGNAVGVAGSAADEAVAERLIATCTSTYDNIDILVNCAGIAEPARSSILDVRTRDWRALLDSHITTVFNTCRVAAPVMAARGSGSIITTGSFAYLGDYGGTGYPAGKGAVISLTLAIAAELRRSGVRVNAVCPGAKTRLSTGPDYEAHIHDLHDRGLLDEMTMQASLDAPPPEYAAALYLYLASDFARQVTGEIFVTAGGFVGSFPRPALAPIGYRDHHNEPPWSVAELHALIEKR